ncbi:YihY/virulence factor BrkB family protein [Halocola ammonii]
MSVKKGKLRAAYDLVKTSLSEFGTADPMTHAAAIAFYTIFSLPAAIFIIVFSAGYIYGQEAVTGELFYQIKDLVGENAAKQIQAILSNVKTSGNSFLATLLTIGALLFGATTVFISIQNGLNSIWGVKPKPSSGILKFALDRMWSFTMVLSLGFLLLVSLIIDTVLVVLADYVERFLPEVSVFMMQIANFAISLGVIAAVFTLIFKVLPDVKTGWRQCWVGGFITSGLFFIGKYLIGFYLSQSDLTSTYGAAGSLVLILIWVFYSSVILLLGGKVTEVYVKEVEGQVRPSKFAIRFKHDHITDE